MGRWWKLHMKLCSLDPTDDDFVQNIETFSWQIATIQYLSRTCWPRAPLIRALTNIVTISLNRVVSTDPLPLILCIFWVTPLVSSFNLRRQMSPGSCQKVSPNWWWPSLIKTICSVQRLISMSSLTFKLVSVDCKCQWCTAIIFIEMLMLVSFRSKTMNYDSSFSDIKRTFSH